MDSSGGELAPAMVARHGGGWYLWRPGEADGAPVTLAELRDLVGPGTRATTAIDESWIGRLSDGVIRVGRGDAALELGFDDLIEVERRRVVAPAVVASSLAEDRVLAGDLLPASDRPVLRDQERARQLATEGYVTLPVLSASQVEELRAVYGELHGWEGEGFDPDPGNPDIEYRRRIAAALDRIVVPALAEELVGCTPVLRSFYTKWPNTPETDLHWDWSCVDEQRGHRAYQAWIALQDTEESNGHMMVLPRSHRVDARPRGTGLAIPVCDELAQADDVARQRLAPVPLRAGEAMVFDLGLVHMSTPNVSNDPRVAIVVLFRPDEAPLAYYRRVSEGAAIRYDMDDDWYNSMVPAHLVDERPARMPSAVVPLEDPARVARRLEGILASRSV